MGGGCAEPSPMRQGLVAHTRLTRPLRRRSLAEARNGPRLGRLACHEAETAPVSRWLAKGITFDSGGLSLKSPTAMRFMRPERQ